MLNDDLLFDIHEYLSAAFSEDITQEVITRLYERRNDESIENWYGYALTSARHLLWEYMRRGNLSYSIIQDTAELEEGSHESRFTPHTRFDEVEQQLIAREQLRALAKNKYGLKVIKYTMEERGSKHSLSRQYVEQLRRKLRKELDK